MTKTHHKRTAMASIFQNGFLEIPNVPKGTVVTEKVTYVNMSTNFHWKIEIESYSYL